MRMSCIVGVFVVVLGVGARAAAQVPSILQIDVQAAADGTRYRFEVPLTRLAVVPQWDARAVPDPPVSAQAARTAAEKSLASRAPDVKSFELADSVLRGVAPGDTCHNGLPYPMCWHYRLTFDPVVGGHRMAGGGHFVVVVLLDGSVVEPRIERAGENVARGTGPQPDPPTGAYRAGGPVTPPRVTREIRTQYTPEAMRAKITGTVVVEGIVRPDGTVANARVVRSLDPVFGLDAEALKAFSNYRFAPGTLNGMPVPVFVTMTMTFNVR